MCTVTSVTSSAPETPVILDWSNPKHWAHDKSRPCYFCSQLTRLRIDSGHNALRAHKVCAEKYLTNHPTRELPR